MIHHSADAWIQFRRPRPEASVRLFCLHHAGGGALGFRDWPERFPDWVDVCPVQLPGRGSRYAVPPSRRLDALLDGLLPALRPLLDRPVALFGHSMGAGIAIVLAHALPRPPLHLFVAAGRVPGAPRPRPLYLRADSELLDYLGRLGGTPEPILRDAEMREMVLRILRADLELSETSPAPRPLSGVKITVLGGLEDQLVNADDLDGWRSLTDAAFQRVMLPGGHFFIQNNPDAIARLIAESLAADRG